MKRVGLAFLVGLVFGAGLDLSQMTNPAKVLNFLDLFGRWDPSLAFVMGGGVLVGVVGLRLNRFLKTPLAAPRFVFSSYAKIDVQLISGAALFGIGWGLSGFCPGPAIANLGVLAGVYNTPAIYVEVTGALTNTMLTAQYRGAGRQEAEGIPGKIRN